MMKTEKTLTISHQFCISPSPEQYELKEKLQLIKVLIYFLSERELPEVSNVYQNSVKIIITYNADEFYFESALL